MKYLFFCLMALTVLIACNKSENDHSGVGIRVINQSSVDFDTLRFQVSVDSFDSHELVFTGLDAGDKSDYLYVDQLEYMYYTESDDFIFFSNFFYGITNNDTLFETGYGFCGTGLQFKVVDEGKFRAVITGIDETYNRMFISQEKE